MDPGDVGSSLQLVEARRAVAQMAGAGWDHPGRVYRLAAPHHLAQWRPDGNEEVLEHLKAGPSLPSGSFSAEDEVIPLELQPGVLWGYWVVHRSDAARAYRDMQELLRLIEQTGHLQDLARLEHMNHDLMAVLDLGATLSRTEGPGAMMRVLHKAARQVLGAGATHMALVGVEGGRCYTCVEGGEPSSSSLQPKAWLQAFPHPCPPWVASSPLAAEAAQLLKGEPMAGIAERVGDPSRPHGILLVERASGGFSRADQSFLSRMADFVFAALLRWERSGRSKAKGLAMPDLFVLLAQEKERLEQIMQSVPVGLLLTDSEGVIALANDAAGKALELTDVELREKKLFRSRPAGRAIHGLIEKTREEGEPVSTPYEIEGRWFQIHVIPWPGGAQFLVVSQDIHDWFQLNHLKEDLISIISHEVKNPLTAVLNAAHVLSSGRAGAMNEPQQRLADLMQESSIQIKNLLDDVVRLSRIYHLSSKMEPVFLAPIVRAIHDRSTPMLQAKLMSWTESLEDATVGGEQAMLETLLGNLIGNAIKYTGIGGRVGVRLWAEGDHAKLRVLDDGPGIPPDELGRLFMPFFRASNIKEQVAGTGLGLVIARNIAEKLGGTLHAVSPLTAEDAAFLGVVRGAVKGSAFQIELLLAR